MPTFDDQLRKVAACVGAMRAGGEGQTREFHCPASVEELARGLPIRVGPGANPRIILRGEAFVELGGPSAGSCGLVLWTRTPSLLADGRITVIGPDVQEAPGVCLPFAQIVTVGGQGLGPEEHPAVQHAQHVADQIEGYMVRSADRTLWGRVSRDAAAKGFSLEVLGRALMILFRTSLPKLEAIEIVFVTASTAGVRRLADIAAEAHEVGATIVKGYWKARGFDLDCDLDCRSCHDKQVCDDLRKVLAARVRRRTAARPRAPRKGGVASGSR